ncbi:unnamed protein product [Echinostoma caproni]|uniref:Neur_chan_LBD domain-containing protein n=1 Tax=Echinostoma caproni TaxID=27848 RepID=A0A183ACW1_9TREM|nr:unnamed protein product [Echinostoma caproni]
MVIQYGLQLIQILHLDENKQVLRTNCWTIYRWVDPLLKWNASQFQDLKVVRMLPKQIWTPDIKLYNFADERLQEYREGGLLVHNDGTILWLQQALFKSTCQVETTYFPFDSQVCMLEFGSLTYDKTLLELQWWTPDDSETPMPYVDFSDYVPANEWFADGEAERHLRHEERTKQSMPTAVKNFPLIGVFFCLNMVMITLSTYLATIVVNLFYRGQAGRPLPVWVRRLFIDGFGRMLWLRQYIPLAEIKRQDNVEAGKTAAKSVEGAQISAHSSTTLMKKIETNPETEIRHRKCSSKLLIPGEMTVSRGTGGTMMMDAEQDLSEFLIGAIQPIYADTCRVNQDISCFKQRQTVTRERDEIAMEWRTLALVVDRLFFMLYLFIMAVALGTVILNTEVIDMTLLLINRNAISLSSEEE